jgi:hypothetical protein
LFQREEAGDVKHPCGFYFFVVLTYSIASAATYNVNIDTVPTGPGGGSYIAGAIVGFDQAMIDAIDKWRAKQKPLPNVSEAIRRLVELGLKAKSW